MAVPVIIKAASAVLSSEKLRKAAGWIAAAICSPFILLLVLLCSIGSGAAEHNAAALQYCFTGESSATELPAEYTQHLQKIGSALSKIEAAIPKDSGLDSTWVKAVYYALCFDNPVDADAFAACFYDSETVAGEVFYTVLSTEQARLRLSELLNREISDADLDNAAAICNSIFPFS